jgi:hypothetical protein
VFRLGLLPATLSVREKLVDNSRVVTIDPATISAMQMGPCPAEHVLYLECLESDVRGTLRPRPRRTQVVVFVPERGGNEERWLLPDFEVLGTMLPSRYSPYCLEAPVSRPKDRVVMERSRAVYHSGCWASQTLIQAK